MNSPTPQTVASLMKMLTLPQLVEVQTLLEDDGIYFYIGLAQESRFAYAAPTPCPAVDLNAAPDSSVNGPAGQQRFGGS